MIKLLVGVVALSTLVTSALAADPLEVRIGYLRRAAVRQTLSLVEQPAENDGVAGARVAVEDNNTTGKFLNQHFTLQEVHLKQGEDASKAAVTLADRNTAFIIVDLPEDIEALVSVRRGEDVRKGGAVFVNQQMELVDLREKSEAGGPTTPWYNASKIAEPM